MFSRSPWASAGVVVYMNMKCQSGNKSALAQGERLNNQRRTGNASKRFASFNTNAASMNGS